jgi:hypothetical protein
MKSDYTAPTVLPFPRCGRCAGRLEHLDGESYCPDCVTFTTAAELPPASWFDARTSDGNYVHGGRDLGELVAWVRDVVSADDDLVLVTPACQVVAVPRGDSGQLVRVR